MSIDPHAPAAARPAHPGGTVAIVSLRAVVVRHAPGIVLALLLAAVLVAPRWWLIATDPPAGVRTPLSVWGASNIGTDEILEASAIRQAYDGKLPLRAPYLANHRDGPLQAGAFWQQAIGVLGHVTGGPFTALAVVTTMMAVWALFSLYVLAVALTRSRLAALAILPITLMAIQVFNQADGFAALRHWDVLKPVLTADPRREFHVWMRFLAPVLVLGTFFTTVLVLPRAVETGRRGWMLTAAALLALLVYSYVFYWTAMAAAVALWAVWLALRGEYASLRRLAVVGFLAVLLALPELAIVASKSLSATADVKARVGQDDLAILPAGLVQRVAIGLPFAAVLWRGPSRNGLLIALTASPLALTSVGGVVPQEWHYRTQVWGVFALPALIAGSAAMIRYVPRRLMLALQALLGVAAVVGLVFLVTYQVRALATAHRAFAVSDDEGAALAWVRAHVRGDQTVVSSSVTTNLLLASLTPSSEYIMDGYNPVASDGEIIDRFLRAQVAFGYGEDATFLRLDPENGTSVGEISPQTRDALERGVEEQAAYFLFYAETDNHEDILRRFPEWHGRFSALQVESDVLAAYPADYVYCGDRERFWSVARRPAGIYVRVAFRQGSVTIYRLSDAADPAAEQFMGCG